MLLLTVFTLYTSQNLSNNLIETIYIQILTHIKIKIQYL